MEPTHLEARMAPLDKGVRWGTASNLPLADPGFSAIPCPLGPARSAADRSRADWRADVSALVGSAATDRRYVLGWRHLQPEAPGRWDRAALDRCDRHLDSLLALGVDPWLTLLDVDLPAWAERDGGWLNRRTAERFAAYAAEVGRRFGDRVQGWITSTELVAPSVADHVLGMLPNDHGCAGEGVRSVHHVLLGHGLAAQALRAAGVRGDVGTTSILISGYPALDDPWDRSAVEDLEFWSNRLMLEPLLTGRHLATEEGYCPVFETGAVREGDLAAIATPLDTLALAWNSPMRVTSPENLPRLLPPSGLFESLNDANRVMAQFGFALLPFDDLPTNGEGWPIMPEALADALAMLHDCYGSALPPLRVSDSGMGLLQAGSDSVDPTPRRSALAAQLAWLADVVDSGVPLAAYEYWPLQDDHEWKYRYARRYTLPVDTDSLTPPPPIPRDWARTGAFARHVAPTPDSPPTPDPHHTPGRSGRRLAAVPS
ncbi:family 1 glycosylhydrolase [Streptomyces sp. NPDC005349]|uniref:family 1 glycosylhydrolase n=1 Tax=Streptomyces sp. NPDC005349 TaxID=3157037 RepID=UPI0033A4A694